MNQSGRMENVRDALRYCVNGDLHAAALAEVEEWEDAIDGWIERAEAAEAALAEITSAYEASVVDQTRLEAAEAEADRLKQRNHELLENESIAPIVLREIVRLIENGQADTARLTALAALAPADRNTT